MNVSEVNLLVGLNLPLSVSTNLTVLLSPMWRANTPRFQLRFLCTSHKNPLKRTGAPFNWNLKTKQKKIQIKNSSEAIFSVCFDTLTCEGREGNKNIHASNFLKDYGNVLSQARLLLKQV